MKEVINRLIGKILPCLLVAVWSHRTYSFTTTTSAKVSKGATSVTPFTIDLFDSSTRQNRHRLVKLDAAKRKRRRKQDSSAEEVETTITWDELPDFDLNEDGAADKVKSPKRTVVLPPSNAMESIKIAGSSKDKPLRSLQALLADRSLEQKFEFDEPDSDTQLPDLAPIKSTTSTTIQSEETTAAISTASRKKERQQEAIRLAKLAAEKEQAENDRNSILNMLPGIRDEKGKISPVKILESGTWACIYMLIAWEIYINTPLFDRAAPMTPVVY
jgi:hypothetical protein